MRAFAPQLTASCSAMRSRISSTTRSKRAARIDHRCAGCWRRALRDLTVTTKAGYSVEHHDRIFDRFTAWMRAIT